MMKTKEVETKEELLKEGFKEFFLWGQEVYEQTEEELVLIKMNGDKIKWKLKENG